MMDTKIAVLLASFNRKEKTLSCVDQVLRQKLSADIQIEIFLTDDASIDGTSEAINSLFPKIHLLNGSGSLFWAGGMRNSWTKAIESGIDFEYYFLLNDDTFLFEDALQKLITQSKSFYVLNEIHPIVVGTTINPETGEISYGGRKLYSKFGPRSYLVNDGMVPVECDLGNANVMLVHKSIVDKIGILNTKYIHSLADYDYTLRAKKNGFKVIVAPGFFGSCTRNHGKNWKSSGTSLKERIEFLYSPKGLAYNEYLFFIKKYFPFHFPEAIFKLWLKTFLPIIYDKLKK